MSNRSHSSSNFLHKTVAVQSKDITWKDILFSIVGGYVCVAFFFVLARYTALISLFHIPGRQRDSFSEEFYYLAMVVLFAAYTIYTANKIFWFVLRKNGYCSAIYGSIRRFCETYFWCFFIVFIPFCFLKFYFGDFYVDSMIERNDVRYFDALFRHANAVNLYLVPLILALRVIITCHRLTTNKPIGKPEDNARIWQTTEAITSITIYTIVSYFISLLRDFCYRAAMLVLLSTICVLLLYVWLSLRGDIKPTTGPEQLFYSFGFRVFVLSFIFLFVYFLAFSTIMRGLFSVLWQGVRLCASKKAPPPALLTSMVLTIGRLDGQCLFPH